MSTRAPRSLFPALALVVLAAGCAASASVGPAPAAAPTVPAAVAVPTPSASRPTTEDGCKACNGLWGVHGISPAPSCNCRTTDGGKRCRDGAACQGLCLVAEPPDREIVEVGPPARGYFVGRCSPTVDVFGCYRSIDRGATSRGPVLLTEPPPELCAD